MFGFGKKNNWSLELSGEVFSPVYWEMIRTGLVGLRQTDDDSFLILARNPGKRNEQFLQTALPTASSGLPPVYSVITAVKKNGAIVPYVIEMPELGEVVVFFRDYFNGKPLDLSLFSVMPMYRPE